MLEKIPLTKENVQKVTVYIPYFENTDHDFFFRETYRKEETLTIYPCFYSKEVDSFIETLYNQNIIYPFDWPAWQEQAEKYFKDPNLLEQAGLDTLRRLLTIHLRKERFCEGHLGAVIKSGHILKILKRLKVILENGL